MGLTPVIYETLLYRQAFPGKDWQVVLPAILHDSPERPSQVDPTIDPRLDAIIAKAMARDPAARYQDLRALARDLQKVREACESLEADQAETVTTPIATPVSTPRHTPSRVGTDRARLDMLRKAKVKRHVEAAEAALERSDVDAALAEAEDASLLDVDDTQVMRLLEAVREAHDAREFDTHVSGARHHLAEQSLTEALRLVDQALELQPSDPTAVDLRQAVVQAFDERDRQRERARLLERTLREAYAALESGKPEAAIRAASEVLAYDPNHQEAARLKQQALAAGEERRRHEAFERQARQAVETARREFEAGDHTAAFRRLQNLKPRHPLAMKTLKELKEKAVEVEQQLHGRESSQQRIQSWIADQMTAVQRSIAEEQWDAAVAQVEELRARAPETPNLPVLTTTVEQGRLAARRQREVDEYLDAARRRKTSGDYPAALARVDAALALWEGHPEATALRQEIDELVTTAEEQRESEAASRRKAGQDEIGMWLTTADDALRAGRFNEALKVLKDVDPEAATATQTVRLRELTRDAEGRRRQARAEAARLKKKRQEQQRQRRDALVARLVATGRRAATDRRVQAGTAIALTLLLVVGWVVSRPEGPVTDVARVIEVTQPVSVPTPPPTTPLLPPTPPSDAADDATTLEASAGAGALPPGDGAVEESPSAPAPTVDDVARGIAGALDQSGSGDFEGSFEALAALNQRDDRVARARDQVEAEWNSAAQAAADRARQLSGAGEFGEALALVSGFEPEHGFIDAAREDVERAWEADGADVSRRALELAAAGDHDGAITLLEASVPPHSRVLTTLGELRANPACAAEVPSVREALMAFRLDGGVVAPPPVLVCEGGFRVDIQNELVRFGSGCERAPQLSCPCCARGAPSGRNRVPSGSFSGSRVMPGSSPRPPRSRLGSASWTDGMFEPRSDSY